MLRKIGARDKSPKKGGTEYQFSYIFPDTPVSDYERRARDVQAQSAFRALFKATEKRPAMKAPEAIKAMLTWKPGEGRHRLSEAERVKRIGADAQKHLSAEARKALAKQLLASKD